MIGNWTQLGDFLPKIKDFSEVGYHGHLSPLAGFEAVNSTAIFKGYRNGILQLRGDHIFLPVLSATYSYKFNINFEVAFPVAASSDCSVMAIAIGDGLELRLQHKGSKVRTFKFSLLDGENVLQKQEIRIDEILVNDHLISVNIEGNTNNSIILTMVPKAENTFHQTIAIYTKFKRRQALKGIWLGIRRQPIMSLESYPAGCFYDIKSVTLSR